MPRYGATVKSHRLLPSSPSALQKPTSHPWKTVDFDGILSGSIFIDNSPKRSTIFLRA
jgi:hypothetical protein